MSVCKIAAEDQKREVLHIRSIPPNGNCASRRYCVLSVSVFGSAVLYIRKQRLKDVRYQKFKEVSPDLLLMTVGAYFFFLLSACRKAFFDSEEPLP